MLIKIILMPFLLVMKVAGLLFIVAKMGIKLVLGFTRFIISRVFGTVFGAIIGFFLGSRSIGIRIPWKKK